MGKIAITMLALTFIFSGSAFAQEGHHGHHELWPDSLQTVTVTGTVLVDSSYLHFMYFLDEDGDGDADYHLSFGPWWYEPESGAVRPVAGQSVTIVGAIMEYLNQTTLIVFEIDGLTWREPVAYGMHGWNDTNFWDMQGDTMTVTGVVFVDTTYFYEHYFLDTNADSIPEYKLGFGPPWYEPESGATRPAAGETVTIFGRLHDMPGIDLLAVYVINGLEWRPLDEPAPWAGMWVHRDHADTSFAYCVNDSGNRIGFPAGHMGGHMGGMFPDSIFVQFWVIHPDSLPGGPNQEHFRGFYLDVSDPFGNSMMNGQFGGHHGRMQFQMQHQYRFHYVDQELQEAGFSEQGIGMQYWDDDTQQWIGVTGMTVNTDDNTILFSSSDLSNYYVIVATSVTGVASPLGGVTPADFVLQQNYPNPFNPTTSIHFELPVQAHVQLAVYNLLGQRVALLIDENRPAGGYTVQWDGKDDLGRGVSSGIYLARFEADGQVRIQRMTLLK